MDFIDDVLKLNIYEKAAAYNKSVLLLHGDKDITVPLNASEKYLDKYETKAVLHVVEGADHTFKNKKWEDEVIEYTLGFFEGEFR